MQKRAPRAALLLAAALLAAAPHAPAQQRPRPAASPRERLARADVFFAEAERLRTQTNSPEALDRAVGLYERALGLLDPEVHTKRYNETLTALARVHLARGDIGKSLDYFDRIFPINTIADMPQAERVRHVQKAIELYLSFDMAEKRKTIEILDRVLAALAVRGVAEQTLRHILTAVGVEVSAVGSAATGESESWTLVAIGYVHTDIGERKLAEEYLARALQRARESRTPHAAAYALMHMATIHARAGKYAEARARASESLEVFKELERAGNADRIGAYSVYLILSQVYSQLNDSAQARHNFSLGLQELRAFESDPGGGSLSVLARGQLLLNIGTDESIAEAVRLLESVSNAEDVASLKARAYWALGYLHDRRLEYRQGLENFLKALALYEQRGDADDAINLLIEIGLSYIALDEPYLALEYFGRALKAARAAEDREREAYALASLMYLWSLRLDNRELAIIYGKQAVALYQAIRGENMTLETGLRQGFLRSRADHYRRLADLLITAGRIPEAERVLEMLKEEEYREYRQRDPEVTAALLKLNLSPEERRVLEDYERLAPRLTALGVEVAALYDERLKLPENAVFPRQARIDEIERQFAAARKMFDIFRRKYPTVPGEVLGETPENKLSGWKAKDAALVWTVVSQDRLHLIVTTPNSPPEPYTVNISAAELHKLVGEFRDALRRKCACVDPRPAGAKLYEILVKTIADDLKIKDKDASVKTLLWVLDSTLRYIPVAALWDAERKQYLAEQYDNVVMTLKHDDNLVKDPKPVADWRILGLGVSNPFPGFRALPAVEDELKAIVRRESQDREPLPGETGLLPGERLLNDEFKLDRFKRARGRYSVVHIASHFDFLPDKRRSSALLLGDGTLYSLGEVEGEGRVFEGVELLALSACDTGVGGEQAGGEVENFGVLAQEKGANAVLATLWKVDDVSTGPLMHKFYSALKERPELTKAAALRQAQLALIEGKIKVCQRRDGRDAAPEGETSAPQGGLGGLSAAPPYKFEADRPCAHPFFWAPFILMGNWK